MVMKYVAIDDHLYQIEYPVESFSLKKGLMYNYSFFDQNAYFAVCISTNGIRGGDAMSRSHRHANVPV